MGWTKKKEKYKRASATNARTSGAKTKRNAARTKKNPQNVHKFLQNLAKQKLTKEKLAREKVALLGAVDVQPGDRPMVRRLYLDLDVQV